VTLMEPISEETGVEPVQDALNGTHLILPEVLDIAAAEGLLSSLLAHLKDGTPLRLDASGVQTLTLPCAQILLAALRSDGQLFIDAPSAAFIEVFEDLGLDWTERCASRVEDTPEQCVEQTHEQGEDRDLNQDKSDEQPMTKRILTIDDSKTIREMLLMTLSSAGFEVLQAVDGQDGLDVLEKETERVDVVITDINMPRMDGYEVIRQLRRNSAHKATPILVLTTESEVEKRNLARDTGATGWIVKPFDPDRLIEAVRKVAR
jgi:two-component system chemotaxis response regulator CheY